MTARVFCQTTVKTLLYFFCAILVAVFSFASLTTAPQIVFCF